MPHIGEAGPVLYASGSDADDGAYTTALVAAVTGKKIRVLAISITVLTMAGTVALAGSGTTWTAHLGIGAPFVQVGSDRVPVYETTSGTALTATNGTGVDSFINLTFCLVEP